jgi:tyrosine-protein kinase Etk/Wzc
MAQYELNLREYWQIIRKRWLVLVFIFFVVLIPTVILTNLQKQIYQASASVQWMERKNIGNLLTDLLNVQYEDIEQRLETESRKIISLPLLEKVAVELKLVNQGSSSQEIMQEAGQLQAAVSTSIITGTRIIRVIVTHEDPKLAADIANKTVDVYIAENLIEKTTESRNTKIFIEKQLAEITDKLRSSEEALAQFREKEVPSGVGLPLANRLAELETEKQKLLQQYTPMHPDIKSIEEQIEQVKEQLKALPQKELEYSRLQREVEIHARLYTDLKDKVEAARIAEAEKSADVNRIDKAVVPLSPISPNRPLNYLMGALIGFMLGLSGIFLVEQLDTSIGTIDDIEAFLKLPALGVIPYLKIKQEKGAFLDKIREKKYKGEEKTQRLRGQLLVQYPDTSSIFEAYRILKANILSEVLKEKTSGSTLLFSSSGPEEGKSITISNLSIVMAQGGLRTLLVDADIRRSVIHKIFGLKNREPGLSDCLRGTVNFKDAIRTFTDILMGELGFDGLMKIPGLDNLSILTSGSSSNTTAELLASQQMTDLLHNLKEKFDLILFDSPPLLAVADTMVLAPKMDSVILIYRVGKTGRSILLRTKKQLAEAKAKLKGVVLNNISPALEMRYGYYYHYKYYGKYYGEKKEET